MGATRTRHPRAFSHASLICHRDGSRVRTFTIRVRSSTAKYRLRMMPSPGPGSSRPVSLLEIGTGGRYLPGVEPRRLARPASRAAVRVAGLRSRAEQSN